ncbi:MAG: DUF2796 domain-containing protein [Pseudomonadota bacterium]
MTHNRLFGPGRSMAVALGLAFASAASSGALAADSLDAHVHGVSAMDIAVDGTTMLVSLRMPGADVVGFEREARTDAEKKAVKSAETLLRADSNVLAIPAAAKCSLVKASVEIEGGDDHADHDDHDHAKKAKKAKKGSHSGHDHDHDHGHEETAAKDDDHGDHDHDHGKTTDAAAEDDGHNEFHAEYTFNCGSPDRLDMLTVNLFKHFPRAEKVKASVVGPTGQFKQTLTPKSVSLAMRPS